MVHVVNWYGLDQPYCANFLFFIFYFLPFCVGVTMYNISLVSAFTAMMLQNELIWGKCRSDQHGVQISIVQHQMNWIMGKPLKDQEVSFLCGPTQQRG